MGPLAPPYTGQSTAFTAIVEHYKAVNEEKVILINLSNTDNIISGLLILLQISYQFLFNKIDLVYFTCSRSFLGSIRDIIMLLWAKIFNVKVVNHLHGADFSEFYNNSTKLHRALIKFAYNKIDTSIVLLNKMKEQFSSFPNMRVEVVPNSYSSLFDKCSLTKNNNQSNTLSFLYLSNLIKSKGILIVLDAFVCLLQKYDNICLNIAGVPMSDEFSSEKEISQAFFAKIKEIKANYPDKIHYLGAVSGLLKINLLWNSDIFLLPTFYKTEAFPISILEALRSGNYIVTTQHNYIPEIINENNGLFVKANSLDSLTEAMEYLINHPDNLLDVKNYNISYAVENYRQDKYIHNVIQIINENLNSHSNI